MKRIKTNFGFTLIEIIVTLIIVGVLAAVALPNLFANIERSRASEAFVNISNIKNYLEACFNAKGAPGTECSFPTNLMGQQGKFFYQGCGVDTNDIVWVWCHPGNGFSSNTDTGYTILASSGVPGNGSVWSDSIYISREATPPGTTPTFTCHATGVYAGVC